ncbi:hypothetical protein PoB_003642400 [Plakobranchus ocellatus]|uniref:Uncharacterized protein n=1 Tax=Plakobranchus ocellatus TaxID=259542 RepID=A0AAV4AQ58_9GAST|nr:hypothetical protein PoB_003642400 [Plakobranchus ocellatus]
MDPKCYCVKTVLEEFPPEEEPQVIIAKDSTSALDACLTAKTVPLSIAERRLNKMEPVKLFKNRVDRVWHKRYNYVLPEDEQFEIQPIDEIQYRDEGECWPLILHRLVIFTLWSISVHRRKRMLSLLFYIAL